MKRTAALLVPLAFLFAGCESGTDHSEPTTATGFEQLTANLDEASSATSTRAEAFTALSALTGEEDEDKLLQLADRVCAVYQDLFNPATDPGTVSAEVADFITSDPGFAGANELQGFDPSTLDLGEMKVLLVRSAEVACPKWTEEAFVFSREAH